MMKHSKHLFQTRNDDMDMDLYSDWSTSSIWQDWEDYSICHSFIDFQITKVAKEDNLPGEFHRSVDKVRPKEHTFKGCWNSLKLRENSYHTLNSNEATGNSVK